MVRERSATFRKEMNENPIKAKQSMDKFGTLSNISSDTPSTKKDDKSETVIIATDDIDSIKNQVITTSASNKYFDVFNTKKMTSLDFVNLPIAMSTSYTNTISSRNDINIININSKDIDNNIDNNHFQTLSEIELAVLGKLPTMINHNDNDTMDQIMDKIVEEIRNNDEDEIDNTLSVSVLSFVDDKQPQLSR